jgi:hypothetical protein
MKYRLNKQSSNFIIELALKRKLLVNNIKFPNLHAQFVFSLRVSA